MMSYPGGIKSEDPNAEARSSIRPLPTPTIPSAGVIGPQGGAPTLSVESMPASPTAEDGFRLRSFDRGTAEAPRSITPPVAPLQQVRETHAAFVEALKPALQKRLAELSSDERQRPFWQGVNKYPEWMATLIARRAWMNRMQAQGPVADWMKYLDTLRR